MMVSMTELYNQMGLLGSVITGLIILLFIAGFYINILVRRRYLSLSQELATFCAGDINEFRSDMLAWITEEYKASLSGGVENINTTAIIDMALEAYQKPCNIGESFLRKINGLLITLGLFGTFLGLTSAVGQIGNMISETSAEALVSEAGINTLKILISSFKGMSVAFITSLFGTGFSIMLSFLTTFIGSQDAKKLFVTQLEEYLDIKLAAEFMENKNKKAEEEKDKNLVLANTFADSITLFNKTVTTYSEELNFLKDFNKELRENLCQADNSIAALNYSLNKVSEAFNKSGLRLSECSDELNNLVKEIKLQNRRLESMNGIFAGLSQKLDESTQDRTLYLKTISEIPDRLLNYTEAAVARIEKRM